MFLDREEPSCVLTRRATRPRALTSEKHHVRRDENGQIVGDGGEDQEDNDTQGAAEAALLHFSTRATPRPSRPSSAPGSTGRSPWSGWRVTKPSSGGGRRTRSPASTPFPTTSRSKSKSASRRTSRWADGSINSGKPYAGELEASGSLQLRCLLSDCATSRGFPWFLPGPGTAGLGLLSRSRERPVSDVTWGFPDS